MDRTKVSGTFGGGSIPSGAAIIVSILLCACPTYDPPQGLLTVLNNSESTIYIYVTCSDSILRRPALALYESPLYHTNDTLFPDYRIKAHSFSSIAGFGSRRKRKMPCDDNLRIFVIKESIMRTKSWEEIYLQQLYEDKIIVGAEELNDMNWIISYNPFKIK